MKKQYRAQRTEIRASILDKNGIQEFDKLYFKDENYYDELYHSYEEPVDYDEVFDTFEEAQKQAFEWAEFNYTEDEDTLYVKSLVFAEVCVDICDDDGDYEDDPEFYYVSFDGLKNKVLIKK